MRKVKFQTIAVDAFNVFYREAGPRDAPAVLLLHGFPSAGHMFRDLIPQLSDNFRVVAPDLPGFGRSDMPERSRFSYTFDNLAGIIERFTEVIGLARFALYVFDYGAPTGFRLAMRHPERIAAIISQNGNAYLEGLSDGWNPIRAYWQDPSAANRAALRSMLSPETTVWQYTHGVSDPSTVSPDGYSSTISIWRDRGRTRCSSTSSATTRATSRSIRCSKPISGSTSRRSWRSGAATIRSSSRPAPRLSSATCPMPRCAFSTPVTLPSRPTPGTSRPPCAISFAAERTTG
jgi:pimeloyl-ACP methyl ester carboxylesterase